MVTEPPSMLAHHLRKLTTMQLPPKELRPLKLPLEAALELKTSKLFVISEKQHLCILEEAFRGSEPDVLHHYILCAKKSCKSLSSNKISRQLPSKPHVFKHDWIDDDIVFCCKNCVWWLAFKESEGMRRE